MFISPFPVFRSFNSNTNDNARGNVITEIVMAGPIFDNTILKYLANKNSSFAEEAGMPGSESLFRIVFEFLCSISWSCIADDDCQGRSSNGDLSVKFLNFILGPDLIGENNFFRAEILFGDSDRATAKFFKGYKKI
jgi:hypothetical protein